MKKKKKEAYGLSRTPWPFDFPVLPDHLELPDYHNHPDRTLSTTLTSSNTQTSLLNPITLTTPATSDNLATLANPAIQTSTAPVFQREPVLTLFSYYWVCWKPSFKQWKPILTFYRALDFYWNRFSLRSVVRYKTSRQVPVAFSMVLRWEPELTFYDFH